MLMDLHNHTTFSYDGKNTPEEIIENAIAHGIDAIGITDHQFSIGSGIERYVERLQSCKQKYSPYIKVLAGLEIGTRPRPSDLFTQDIEGLDYVLFECLDDTRAADFFEFISWRHRFTCPVGLAHCDIFALGERYGLNILDVLREENIFWELNTSGHYDIYYDFLSSTKMRGTIYHSGIGVSIGSDTHSIDEYRFKQLKHANELAEQIGFTKPFVFK